MKHKPFKGTTFLCMLLLMAMVFVLTITPAFASGLNVVGSDIGLKVTPENTGLFNELSLNPGDYKQGTITVSNTRTAPFELYVKAQRSDAAPAEGQPDLFSQLQVTVTFRGSTLYSGALSGFANGNGVDLGLIAAGESQDLAFAITLPGANTGNEYMNTSVKPQWTFTALNQARASLKIQKVDAASKAVLSGAVFGVYTDAALTKPVNATLTTDANGEVLVEGLMPGPYYVNEITPPKGYFKTTVSIPVTLVNDQTITVQIPNTKEAPYVTGTDDYNALIAGGALLLVGAAFMILALRRKKAIQ